MFPIGDKDWSKLRLLLNLCIIWIWGRDIYEFLYEFDRADPIQEYINVLLGFFILAMVNAPSKLSSNIIGLIGFVVVTIMHVWKSIATGAAVSSDPLLYYIDIPIGVLLSLVCLYGIVKHSKNDTHSQGREFASEARDE